MSTTQKANNTPSASLLERIDSPDDLRKLSVDELPALCADIRQFLIANLATNPGHFASSMGAVEITVALHYVFNTPYDRIVWDVGHQAYAHKILTGRREAFAEGNRKKDGLSGFPSPKESDYDTFTAGHASNSISAALGMSVASMLNNDSPRRHVVAVIGDASISGGLAFEGVNNAANTPNDLLIILNDNDMSIDRNVGALNRYLTHINTSPAYNAMRYRIYKLLRKMHLVSERRRRSILRFNNSLKSIISHQQNIFEGLNIRYFGPFDGHDIKRVVRVLNDIKNMSGPKILHLRTVKGKGYEAAEKDPATWHAPGKFDPATGERIVKPGIQPPKWQDVFGKTLVELAADDSDIVAITAAMPSGTSVSEMQRAYPERTFDVGISEGHAVTFAGGLAKEGKRPFVAIYSSFLQRAYDHIIHDAAIAELPVTLCIDRAGLVGEDGVTHHGLYDLAYLSPIPGITIASPADSATLRNLLYTAAKRSKGVMAIRYPRGNASTTDRLTPMQSIEIGRGRTLSHSDGAQVAFLSLGPIADEVTKAIEQLRAKGIEASHFDMIFVKPLDHAIVDDAARTHKLLVTVEDASVIGGLGQAVVNRLNDIGCDTPVVKVGVPDRFVAQGTPAELYRLCGMDAQSIADRVAAALNPLNIHDR